MYGPIMDSRRRPWRWKNTKKEGGKQIKMVEKIRDSILVEFSLCGAVILVLDLVGVIV